MIQPLILRLQPITLRGLPSPRKRPTCYGNRSEIGIGYTAVRLRHLPPRPARSTQVQYCVNPIISIDYQPPNLNLRSDPTPITVSDLLFTRSSTLFNVAYLSPGLTEREHGEW